MKWMLKSLSVAMLLGLFTVMVGCNTMEGAGKDIEKGGDKIKDAARDAKN